MQVSCMHKRISLTSVLHMSRMVDRQNFRGLLTAYLSSYRDATSLNLVPSKIQGLEMSFPCAIRRPYNSASVRLCPTTSSLECATSSNRSAPTVELRSVWQGLPGTKVISKALYGAV